MKKGSENGTARVDGGAAEQGDETSANRPSNVAKLPGTEASSAKARRQLKLSTVSHTLDEATAQRLRRFAFRERISESAVIEHSLRELFVQGDDSQLGRRLRDLGAGLRRKA